MPGLFYDPQVHNWGAPLSKGLVQGAELGMKFKKMMGESELVDSETARIDEQTTALKNVNLQTEKVQTADAKIAELHKSYQDDVTKLQETIKQPSTPQGPKLTPEIQRMMGESRGITSSIPGAKPFTAMPSLADAQYEGGLRAVQDQKNTEAGAKAKKETQDALIARSQKLMTDKYDTYMAHALPDKAQEIKDHLWKNIKEKAALDIDAAAKGYNGSLLAREDGPISIKKQPNWDVKDGIIYDKNGAVPEVTYLRDPDQVKTLTQGQSLVVVGKDGIAREIFKGEKPVTNDFAAFYSAGMSAGKTEQQISDEWESRKIRIARESRPPKQDNALVKVVQDDGTTVYVPRSEAAGQKAPSGSKGSKIDKLREALGQGGTGGGNASSIVPPGKKDYRSLWSK